MKRTTTHLMTVNSNGSSHVTQLSSSRRPATAQTKPPAASGGCGCGNCSKPTQPAEQRPLTNEEKLELELQLARGYVHLALITTSAEQRAEYLEHAELFYGRISNSARVDDLREQLEAMRGERDKLEARAARATNDADRALWAARADAQRDLLEDLLYIDARMRAANADYNIMPILGGHRGESVLDKN